jgi:hypothetical protein
MDEELKRAAVEVERNLAERHQCALQQWRDRLAKTTEAYNVLESAFSTTVNGTYLVFMLMCR